MPDGLSPDDLSGGYEGTTYYGLPVVKPGHYGWLIAAYFFIGGLASAAQFIVTVAELIGGREQRRLVRTGRYLALLGSLASPPLLIADLYTPQRWFNMLRIFRPTSPMSIGSWALSAFGAFSGLAAFGQALEDLFRWQLGHRLAQMASLPAAIAGGIVSIYTGTLLAASNIPLWASGFPFLSSLFASSAASTASAALALLTPPSERQTHRQLSLFSIFSGISEFMFALLIERSWRRDRAAKPIRTPRLSLAWYLGVFGLGILGPLGVHLAQLFQRRESRRTTTLAAVATLVGGFLLRAIFIFGGRKSAYRPQDYFRFTEPK